MGMPDEVSALAEMLRPCPMQLQILIQGPCRGLVVGGDQAWLILALGNTVIAVVHQRSVGAYFDSSAAERS
jgi:hypothetical protein